MKKLILFSTLQLFTFFSYGQKIILPGDKSINKSLLKSATHILDYSSISNGNLINIGYYKIEVNYNDQNLDVNTTLFFNNKDKPWKDHYVANGNSFNPVSVESARSDRSLFLNFANEITGSHQDHDRNKKTIIKEKPKGSFFDISIYPYLLSALPLTEGYKANIPVYDYEALTADKKFSNVEITGVYAKEYFSSFTGTHKIWRVEVYEKSSQNSLQYYIDQKTGKFWKIILSTVNGNIVELKNNESDYNPLKSKFDLDATLKLITQGKSAIKGQAFARDNKNGGGLQGMAVLNVNKKQVAGKGTIIVLTPYTAYFKEWNKVNNTNYKKGLPTLPLPEGARDCAKETAVIDDDGNFEFTNLMAGEYLLTTSFLYEHDATLTTITGYTDYFANGIYQGSSAITSSKNFMADVKAKIKTVVKIEKDGEVVNVKLKKTL